MSKPIAVLISDIHFTVPTLERASKALQSAIDKAKTLHVPLVICGDLLDSKAIIRAECANKIIDILQNSASNDFSVYCLIGNHDLLSEKSEEHSLNFLKYYTHLIDHPTYVGSIKSYLIPYQSDTEKLSKILNLPKNSRLIMHQGVQGANMGHYVQDKTSLSPETYKDFRVISGHYHQSQDIKCGRPQKGAIGLFSYIGNPYTLSFGEANDPPKGYAILMDDGLLERVELDLPRHRIFVWNTDEESSPQVSYNPGDYIWLKIYGKRSSLSKLKYAELAKVYGEHAAQFKVDFYYTGVKAPLEVPVGQSDTTSLDFLIDSKQETSEYKAKIKSYIKELLDEDTSRHSR